MGTMPSRSLYAWERWLHVLNTHGNSRFILTRASRRPPSPELGDNACRVSWEGKLDSAFGSKSASNGSPAVLQKRWLVWRNWLEYRLQLEYLGRLCRRRHPLSALPLLPSASLFLRSSIHSETVSLSARRAETRGFSPFPIRAVSSDDSTPDAAKQFEELYTDLKAKWDGVENKTTVGVYAGGAIVALWLSSTIVGAINSLPLLPKLMELIGLGYTAWFIYHYLLFKSSRKELVADIQELKRKVTGAMKEEGL